MSLCSEVSALRNRDKKDRDGYSHLADMWSLGVILFVMLSGEAPFSNTTIENIPYSSPQGTLLRLEALFESKTWATINSEAKHFLSGLLCLDEYKRLNADQALENKWLSRHADILEALYVKAIHGWKPTGRRISLERWDCSSFSTKLLYNITLTEKEHFESCMLGERTQK